MEYQFIFTFIYDIYFPFPSNNANFYFFVFLKPIFPLFHISVYLLKQYRILSMDLLAATVNRKGKEPEARVTLDNIIVWEYWTKARPITSADGYGVGWRSNDSP